MRNLLASPGYLGIGQNTTDYFLVLSNLSSFFLEEARIIGKNFLKIEDFESTLTHENVH